MIINRFIKPYEFLSNFHPCNIHFEGKTYSSLEHAYQAAKTLDENKRIEIQNAESAAKAKKLGRQLVIRDDWENEKYQVMYSLLKEKFHTDEELNKLLMDTYPHELVEGNYWHDNYWGSCFCNKCHDKGQNNLGLLLMRVREKNRPFIKV